MEFVVLNDKDAVSQVVYAPGNALGAQLVVAIAGDAGAFDMGRAAQNTMLAAWGEGVGSVPNGINDRAAAEQLVGKPVGIISTFGYPANLARPGVPKTPEGVVAEREAQAVRRSRSRSSRASDRRAARPQAPRARAMRRPGT